MQAYDVRPNQDDDYSVFFLTTYGDIVETEREAKIFGSYDKVIAASFFCGTMDDWLRVIAQNLRDKYQLDVF